MAERANPFYVYALCYEDGTPFYVGKGHGKRCYRHADSSRRNVTLRGILGNLGSRTLVKKLVIDESEEWAFRWERFYILEFGRKDIGTGMLVNHSNGGEGPTGHVHTSETRAKMKGRVVSQATRLLLSLKAMGNKRKLGSKHTAATLLKFMGNKNAVGAKRSPEYIAKLSSSLMGNRNALGAIRSEEFKAASSNRQKGIARSLEVRARMSESRLRWYAARRSA